jgi:hypothetical protein
MSEDEEEKEKKKQPIFLTFKGDEIVVHIRSLKKWSKNEYFDGSRNVYQIVLNHFDMEDTLIEYHSLEVRDVEYDNFMDKMRENDYIFI